jgi:hypothetical protein
MPKFSKKGLLFTTLSLSLVISRHSAMKDPVPMFLSGCGYGYYNEHGKPHFAIEFENLGKGHDLEYHLDLEDKPLLQKIERLMRHPTMMLVNFLKERP